MDVSILVSTCKPQDTRLWGCEYTNLVLHLEKKEKKVATYGGF